MEEKKWPLCGKDIQDDKAFCDDCRQIAQDELPEAFYDKKEDGDDSGWRFLAGDESDEYLEDTHHFMMFDINYVANLDSAIIPYLKRKIGTELERIEGTDEFQNY